MTPIADSSFPSVSLFSRVSPKLITREPESRMQHVTGIGGLFFRSKDPAALGQWYKEHLGIDLVPGDYSQKPWSQEAGPTVFAPFPHDTDYFGRADKQWMINLRVRDLDAMVEQLRSRED